MEQTAPFTESLRPTNGWVASCRRKIEDAQSISRVSPERTVNSTRLHVRELDMNENTQARGEHHRKGSNQTPRADGKSMNYPAQQNSHFNDTLNTCQRNTSQQQAGSVASSDPRPRWRSLNARHVARTAGRSGRNHYNSRPQSVPASNYYQKQPTKNTKPRIPPKPQKQFIPSTRTSATTTSIPNKTGAVPNTEMPKKVSATAGRQHRETFTYFKGHKSNVAKPTKPNQTNRSQSKSFVSISNSSRRGTPIHSSGVGSHREAGGIRSIPMQEKGERIDIRGNVRPPPSSQNIYSHFTTPWSNVPNQTNHRPVTMKGPFSNLYYQKQPTKKTKPFIPPKSQKQCIPSARTSATTSSIPPSNVPTNPPPNDAKTSDTTTSINSPHSSSAVRQPGKVAVSKNSSSPRVPHADGDDASQHVTADTRESILTNALNKKRLHVNILYLQTHKQQKNEFASVQALLLYLGHNASFLVNDCWVNLTRSN